MTRRRILVAALLGLIGLGVAAPTSSASTTVPVDNGRYACLWFRAEGLCITNPLKDLGLELPTIPDVP